MASEPAPEGPGTAVPVRDAATLILVRDRDTRPRVLMGRRGARAAFLPSRLVFPGGAVDPGDAAVPLAGDLPGPCRSRLVTSGGPSPEALAAAAIRELHEETGLALAAPGDWPDGAPVPAAWARLAAAGLVPDPRPLRFVFRAITPQGQPRRFDARFFLAFAEDIAGDPDDFAGADAELSDLGWRPIDGRDGLDLPFITSVVLDHVAGALDRDSPPEVPFFRGDDERIRAIARAELARRAKD